MSEMITKNHALVAQFGDTLDRLLDGIENFVANSRPTLGGERFLTDREVSARLKVSRRTLQDYRNNGISHDVYSLEMVIAIAFRLRTKECMAFRRFVMGRLNANDSKPINLFFSLSPYNGRRVNN